MIMTGTELTVGRRKAAEIVAEYEAKSAAIEDVCRKLDAFTKEIEASVTIGGAFGEPLGMVKPSSHVLKISLLKSAWRHVFDEYQLSKLATAADKSKFDTFIERPHPFTVQNIFEQFGHIAANPRQTMLRGLAEAFCGLDPFYKSHDKMKIGVSGLPKRVIISGVNSLWGHGAKQLQDVLRALAVVMEKPIPGYNETAELIKNGEYLRLSNDVWLKTFQNGNAHLFFGPKALAAINKGLAEFYGDILPDCPEEKPATRAQSTSISKDLQFYPTPRTISEKLCSEVRPGQTVLEPSCGTGAIMDALKERGAVTTGIEYDQGRAQIARSKGHHVQCANFLNVAPQPIFDWVVMNPPFYGKHYEKHIRHALKFLKPSGALVSVLPVTARYDHKLLDDLRGHWVDLPVGSFAESGTNVNTTIFHYR